MNDKFQNLSENLEKKPEPKPNENGGFYFSSSVKVYDPNTKEILVHKRGDE